MFGSHRPCRARGGRANSRSPFRCVRSRPSNAHRCTRPRPTAVSMSSRIRDMCGMVVVPMSTIGWAILRPSAGLLIRLEQVGWVRQVDEGGDAVLLEAGKPAGRLDRIGRTRVLTREDAFGDPIGVANREAHGSRRRPSSRATPVVRPCGPVEDRRARRVGRRRRSGARRCAPTNADRPRQPWRTPSMMFAPEPSSTPSPRLARAGSARRGSEGLDAELEPGRFVDDLEPPPRPHRVWPRGCSHSASNWRLAASPRARDRERPARRQRARTPTGEKGNRLSPARVIVSERP